jgi:hypothetical protein
MSRQGWEEMWWDDKGAASLGLQNTYTTAKSVINGPVHGLPSIPGNYMNVGSKFKFSAFGATSNTTTAASSMTFQMMLGAVIACTAGAVNLVTTAFVLTGFWIECFMFCTATGSGTNGKLEGIWRIGSNSFAPGVSATIGGFVVAPLTPAAGTGFDSTASQNVDFFVAQSQSSALQGIRIDSWMFESLN